MSVSSSWITLTERSKKPFFYFRRVEIYDQLRWGSGQFNINLSEYIVAVCPFGGPVALMRNPIDSDDDKDGVKSVDTADPTDNDSADGSQVQTIHIMTSAGEEFRDSHDNVLSIKWKWKKDEEGSKARFIVWTQDMKLVLVTYNGEIALFNCRGQQYECDHDRSRLFLKRGGSGANKINEVVTHIRQFGRDGLAVFTSYGRLFVCEDLTLMLKKDSDRQEESALSDVQKSMNKWTTSGRKKKRTGKEKEQQLPEDSAFIDYQNSSNVTKIHAMEVIPKEYSLDGVDGVEVIICPQLDQETQQEDDDNGVFVLSKGGKSIFHALPGEATNIVLSPGGFVLALYLVSPQNKLDDPDVVPQLYVVSPDFSSCHLKLRTNMNNPPDQLAFCTPESVVMNWLPDSLQEGDETSFVMMVNTLGDFEYFTYDGPAHLAQEFDCIRILTNFACELLERVPESTVNVFKIGSLEPSALLYDAYNEYLARKPSSVKTIRDLRNKHKALFMGKGDSEHSRDEALMTAIEECIDAACHEHDPDTQQHLLQAAAYGKTFLNMNFEISMQRRNKFMHRSMGVRVLNEVKRRSCGMPLTYDQVEALTPSVVTSRICEYMKHPLAFAIASYFNLQDEQEKVLLHWACSKVVALKEEADKKMKPDLSNNALDHKERERLKRAEQRQLDKYACEFIKEQIEEKKVNISYSKIAELALKAGRKHLAKFLLELDNNPIEQIPLYLQMHETNLAIEQATKSRDPDLMYIIIFYLSKIYQKEPSHLYEIMYENDEVGQLFTSFCRSMDLRQLRLYYEDVGEMYDAGMTIMLNAYQVVKDEEKHKLGLTKSAECFAEAGKEYTVDKDLAEEHTQLIKYQNILEKEAQSNPATKKYKFIGTSLHDTMARCIAMGMPERALKLKVKFKVSDKRYWNIMIKALAQMKAWDALFEFARDGDGTQAAENQSAIKGFLSKAASLVGAGRKPFYSPVGFEPFVDACLENDAEAEALRYIPMVANVEHRVDFFIRLMKFKEAIEAATEATDKDLCFDLLDLIKTKTRNTKTHDTIEKVKRQIDPKYSNGEDDDE